MYSGILPVNKPEGWTSHDVVAKLRGVLKERRIGHGGTLDPIATGVLVLFVGAATKLVSAHESDDKAYIAGLRLGVTSNTYDITGELTVRESASAVTRERLESALLGFRGELEQLPPMYSAVKVKGKKLYEYARKGQDVQRTPRPVTISRLEVIDGSAADWTLAVECSKGTYVRSLCHEIGETLGVGGVMSSLVRTRSGEFTLAQCHTIEEIIESAKDGHCPWLL
ncbi:MAG: tRNA pseudouridine(55) synthase TruB [Oscillospiraceae bacterium]|jgi:tRNA pseudouridine55 synthase|nr:tRNA pseudouridine(55) synthase TruB [Oscillospiraceae bacterium]